MSVARKVCEAVHITALGLWLGVLVMAGATAALIFPKTREMGPVLPAYEGYDGSQADLVAGMLQNEFFKASDVAIFVGVCLTLLTAIVMIAFLGFQLRRISSFIRLAALGTAVGLASYYLLVLTPKMQTNLKAYWEAAEAGNNEVAAVAKAAFDADHPTASRLLSFMAVSLLVALPAAVVNAASASERERDPKRPDPKSKLERPGLA